MNKPIPIPKPLERLSGLFLQAGAVLYGVGGIVRNGLLGVEPSDIDICSKLMPEQVLSLCEQHGIRCIPKAVEFGTVEIHYEGMAFEHTTFRGQEVYEEGGIHRPKQVTLGASLTSDAFRRDFSCNALYIDLQSGELSDPTLGFHDIQCRTIRTTTKDPKTILMDDGLRVLRLVRFACELGFDIDPATWEAAVACVDGLKDIAWERKREELTKIVLSDVRYPSLQPQGRQPVLYGLELLYRMGALPYLLPELLEGEHVPQRSQYHKYAVMEHNFHACACVPPVLRLRLAALLHDVGKPAALREKGLPMYAGGDEGKEARKDLPHGITPMLGHDALGAETAKAMLQRLRYPTALIEEVAFLIQHHMYDLNGNAKDSTLRGRFAHWGHQQSLDLCDIREADIRGSGYELAWRADRWRNILSRMEQEGAPFSEKELDCTGADIMQWLNLPPGPKIGEIKHRLLLHCARFPKDNTKKRLEKVVRGMG